MNIEIKTIRSHRLRAHHLDKKISIDRLNYATGACGLQNSPPGAWETALFNRLENCSMQALHDALYTQKSLLQAWSYRGAPIVFPTDQSGAFLSPLIAQDGEQPWIYTRGITTALDFVQMTFDDLLPLVKNAAGFLDNHTVQSKEALDQTLADIVQADLPKKKQALWTSPSMYGNPDRQTVGGAIVSFLLRPCSFSSLVVFGRRQGISPTFTSFKNWTGHEPDRFYEPGKELARKFLHCYGPSTLGSFTSWLGSSPKQARRLWNSIADEMEPVQAGGAPCFMLSADRDAMTSAENCEERLILLGAHDPYLDLRDKTVILDDKSLHRLVWKTVSNPGVILKQGRIAGIWGTKTLKDKLDISMTVWESLRPDERRMLETLAEEYAAFRLLSLRNCTIR